MTTLKISEGSKIVDIDSGYDRVVGNLFKNDYGYYFRRSPFTARLTVDQEIEVCYILDTLNNGGEDNENCTGL